MFLPRRPPQNTHKNRRTILLYIPLGPLCSQRVFCTGIHPSSDACLCTSCPEARVTTLVKIMKLNSSFPNFISRLPFIRLQPAHSHKITALRWSLDGRELLSADVNGTVRLWRMKEFLANQWECVAENSVGVGDTVISLSWIEVRGPNKRSHPLLETTRTSTTSTTPASAPLFIGSVCPSKAAC